MTTEVTPWWQALQIRREIITASGQVDDVQMSLYNASHAAGNASPVPYADAQYYGSITYPTARLVGLLAEVAIRLGGGNDYTKARAVTRLDQGMGGGKSHACIGAYHLAANPSALLRTGVGKSILETAAKKIQRELPADLNRPHAVVLACDNLTPFAPDKGIDGPAVTLYERFLWRLFDRDYARFEHYAPFFSDKSKIADAIKSVDRPVLIIIDELLDYMGNGLDGANKPELAAQDMGFLRALLDVINDVPHTAMVVVMIAADSDSIALSPAASKRRDDLTSLLERNGTPETVTEVGDFAEILRRRLFETPPAREVTAATAASYNAAMQDPAWSKNVWSATNSAWTKDWDKQVEDCYPFHPMLIGIARSEWSQVTGFQRVRSTIRIFAATVYALQQRGIAGEWVPALIGPGDLPLSDNSVREAILGSGLVEDDRTIANYRSLAENCVVNGARDGGIARVQDLERGKDPTMANLANPHAAERAATFVFLASIIGALRPGRSRGKGATGPEVLASMAVADSAFSFFDAEIVSKELLDDVKGIGSAVEITPGQGNNKPPLYYLSTRLTLGMLVNDLKRKVSDADRDEMIMKVAERLSVSGPFMDKRIVRADLSRSPLDVLTTAGTDDAHSNRIVILDPAQFSLRNGMELATVEALKSAMGLSTAPGQPPVQWASSVVYAVVNTGRRGKARLLAKEYLARERALATSEVQSDLELKTKAGKELADVRRELEKMVSLAFQHVAYLAQPDPNGERRYEDLTLEADNLTALNGSAVWKALADKDKALDAGQLSVNALIHNLRDSDYGRSLAEIRGAFYNAPRLPLLHGGDADLRQAIFDAVGQGRLRIVDGEGTAVAVTGPGQVNLASVGLLLRLPQCDVCGAEEDRHQCTAAPANGTSDAPDSGTEFHNSEGGGGSTPHFEDGGSSAGKSDPEPDLEVTKTTEKRLSMSFTGNLLGDNDTADKYGALFKALRLACEEGGATYLQGTLDLMLDTASADEITEAAEDLGLTVTLRDQ